MNDRLKELIRLFKILNPEEEITSEYVVRGTSLKTLAETGAGGYQRVLAWARQKVAEKKMAEPSIGISDMKRFYKKAYDVMEGRNKKYGDSWKVLTIQSIANLIEMKMHRIANMAEQNLDPKLVDEFVDSINYAVMGLKKLEDKGIHYEHD